MIITGPGFYTSKAGKCEVVAVQDGFAFGFVLWSHGKYVRVWTCSDGAQAYVDALCDGEITGPWVEPRKPAEAWAICACCWADPELYVSEDAAKRRKDGMPPHYFPRLIHLREVEDSNDNG